MRWHYTFKEKHFFFPHHFSIALGTRSRSHPETQHYSFHLQSAVWNVNLYFAWLIKVEFLMKNITALLKRDLETSPHKEIGSCHTAHFGSSSALLWHVTYVRHNMVSKTVCMYISYAIWALLMEKNRKLKMYPKMSVVFLCWISDINILKIKKLFCKCW